MAGAHALPALQRSINHLIAEGVLAPGDGAAYGPDATVRQGQLLTTLHRFDGHVGMRGAFVGPAFHMPIDTVVTRSDALIQVMNATVLHRGPSSVAAMRAAEQLGLVAGLAGVTETPAAPQPPPSCAASLP